MTTFQSFKTLIKPLNNGWRLLMLRQLLCLCKQVSWNAGRKHHWTDEIFLFILVSIEIKNNRCLLHSKIARIECEKCTQWISMNDLEKGTASNIIYPNHIFWHIHVLLPWLKRYSKNFIHKTSIVKMINRTLTNRKTFLTFHLFGKYYLILVIVTNSTKIKQIFAIIP